MPRRLFNNNPDARVRWTPAVNAKLLELYADGFEFKDIAERLGGTKSAAHCQLSALRMDREWIDRVGDAEARRAQNPATNRGGHPRGVPNPNAGNRNGARSPLRAAKGQAISETMIAVKICVDDETFGEIAEMARSHDRSFSAEARDIMEIGLETLKADGLMIHGELG
jgi:hypothetical protein